MNHKISFKAWDKNLKRWICNWVMCIPAHYEGSKYPIEHGGIDYMCVYVKSSEEHTDCELVHVTTKKDKNGIIICEGDFLKYDDPYKHTAHKFPYLMRWSEDECCFECINYLNYMIPDVWCEMEIVGNRFENPELLEEVGIDV
mgnify:CR=1 FL=1